MGDTAPISLDSFANYVASIDQSSFASDLDRRQALMHAQALLARLQSPRDKATQLLHVDSYLIAAIKSLVNLDLFDVWEKDGGQPKSAQQLAHMTGADPILLARLLRVLVASGMLSITRGDQYVFTRHAQALGSGGLGSSYMLHSLTTANSVIALPRYLTATKYSNPTDSRESPWAQHMGMPFMDYILSEPGVLTYVNDVMKHKNVDTVPWFSFYPDAVDQLVKQCDPDGVILVDVAGGTGYDIRTFARQFGADAGKGRLKLQDLPAVLDQAKDLPAAVEKLPYDFFTEQPIRAARAYFMHNVLHDWSDEDCLSILARLKEAMRPGYSRLLVHENVISFGSSVTSCATDLNMMTVNAGAERTELQWRDLLCKAGFRVLAIHMSPAVDEGLIEAEVPG